MRRLAHLALVAASALAVSSPGAALAKDGSVAGSLAAKPPKQAEASVLATSLADGALLSAGTISKSGAFKVQLPPGAYAISTVVIPAPGGGAASTGRFPVTLKSGQKRTKIKVKTKKVRRKQGSASAAVASRAYVQERGQVTPGVTAFTVEDFTGAPSTGDWQFMNQALTDLLITDLVGQTPCKTAVVANKRDRKLIENELELQKSKYFDPTTRVKRNFIISDLTVNGTIAVAPDGQSAQVTVTINDSRSGKAVDRFTSKLPYEGFFEAEQQLAKAVAERVCRRPAAYELTMTVDGRGDFATHTTSGTLNSTLTALRTGGAPGEPASSWSAIGPFSWQNVSAVSRTDCTYAADPHQGTWTAQLAVAGDAEVKLEWTSASTGAASFTITCPADDGPPVVIGGQPGPALLGVAPTSATLPLAGGTIPLSGGLLDGGHGWTNSGQLVVKPIWSADAPA